MSPEAVHAWFADYLEVRNRHDLDGLRELIAADVRRAHLPRGADAWLAAESELFAAFPDVQWKRITVVVEGDRLAAHLRARGTQRGPFQGVPATGRHVNTAEFAVLRLAGGRVVEQAGSGSAELLTQLTDRPR